MVVERKEIYHRGHRVRRVKKGDRSCGALPADSSSRLAETSGWELRLYVEIWRVELWET
jgi:hypothetical protein